MTRVLRITVACCLLVINQATHMHRCELARVLYKNELDGYEGYSLNDWICLAFVESKFNVSKINENADGSTDYGIFQINSHYWCNNYQSHSENYCHVDCEDLLEPDLISSINCAKKIISGQRGMRNWLEWRLHCAGRPLSHWMTGCHLR
ncbi:lysozyme-like protein 6 [Callospermophilus lateralis]|uniref:lysozyme-like protein 6 n=1 Tax=Callospermophilus lateralis TaxID=76772 RepID=UPI00403869F0